MGFLFLPTSLEDNFGDEGKGALIFEVEPFVENIYLQQETQSIENERVHLNYCKKQKHTAESTELYRSNRIESNHGRR